MAEYITDIRLVALLRSGLDSTQGTPPCSQPGYRDERPLSSSFAWINAQVHTTPLRATEQAARLTDQAAVLPSEHDGAQDSPSTSLPVICNEHPAFPAVAPINVQIQTTLMRATEPAAPVTPPVAGASSKYSLSSTPNNTQSPSLQPHHSKGHWAGQK